VKLRVSVPRPRRRKRRPRADTPQEIVPRAGARDPFDAARDRLKRQIPPREE
jgi:hypothetical protein